MDFVVEAMRSRLQTGYATIMAAALPATSNLALPNGASHPPAWKRHLKKKIAYGKYDLPDTIDLISARTVFYERPTALPTIKKSSSNLICCAGFYDQYHGDPLRWGSFWQLYITGGGYQIWKRKNPGDFIPFHCWWSHRSSGLSDLNSLWFSIEESTLHFMMRLRSLLEQYQETE